MCPGKPLIYADPYPFPGPDLGVFGGRSDHSPCEERGDDALKDDVIGEPPIYHDAEFIAS